MMKISPFCLLVVAMLILVPLLDAQETPSPVTADVFIDNDYDESDQSIDQLQRLLALGFVEVAQPPPGKSMDDYIFARYEFGPTQLPRTFAVIQSHIQEANKGRQAGEPFYIPAIPRRRLTGLNAENPYYDVARLAEFDVIRSQNGRLIVKQQGPTEELFHKGSKYTLMRFSMAPEVWEGIPEDVKERADDLIRNVGQTAVGEKPISYMMPEPTPAPPGILVPPELTAVAAVEEAVSGLGSLEAFGVQIGEVLTAGPGIASAPTTEPQIASAQTTETQIASVPTTASQQPTLESVRNWPPPISGLTARRSTFLFVIDDGWPKPEVARASITFVEQQINGIRAKLKLLPVKIAIPNTLPSTLNHASQVAEAMAEVTAQDQDKLVKVIYIPILLYPETAPLLKELLRLSYLLALLPSNPWREITPVPPIRDDKAAERATEMIGDWQAILASAKPDDWVLRSEVLNAIYDIGQFVSESKDTVFIVNQSWSVRGGIYKLSPTDRSLTVAAAGKVGVDIVQAKLDFARRAATDEQFVAVMIVDANGVLLCGSAKFDENDLDTIRVVAFDGMLLPSKNCGTSFAAPRIAWALAARMSNATAPPNNTWHTELQQALRALRSNTKPFILITDLTRLWK